MSGNIQYLTSNPDIRLVINNVDVSNLVTSVTWSGDIGEVARRLTFSLIKSTLDPYLPEVTVATEDMVQFYAYDQELFRGYVVDLNQSLQSNEVGYTCYDMGFYLLQSQTTKALRQQRPEQVTRAVCDEVGVPVGQLVQGEPYDRFHDGDSIYDIIMTGYTQQSAKDNKQYMLRVDKGAVNVVLKGDYVCPDMLTTKDVVTEAGYSESIVGSCNRVKIFSESRQEIRTIDALDSQVKGVLQKVVQDDGAGNGQTEALRLLKDVQKTANIEGLGRVDCITGNACVVEEPFTGLRGLYYIDGDSHTFDNRNHKMTLTLAFENIMDRTFAGDEEEGLSSTSGGGVPVTGPASEMWNVFRDLGYSTYAISAIIANAEYESGLNPNAVEQGGTGNGRGLFQWDVRNRYQEMIAWANAQGLDPNSIKTQATYADHEMKTQGWLMDGVGGYEAFKNAGSVEQAHEMFYKGFERPKYDSQNYQARLTKSQSYHSEFTALEAQGASVGGLVSDGTWTHPIPAHAGMSSDIGAKWGGSNSGRYSHLGIDWKAPSGTPILATSSGTVSFTGWAGTYGNLVVIDHGGGMASAYAHIRPGGTLVSVGQSVRGGQKIAEVGTTGNSTGNHLHFEIRKGYQGGAYSGTPQVPWNYIGR